MTGKEVKSTNQKSLLAEALERCITIPCPKCGSKNFTFPEQVYGKYFICSNCKKGIKELEIPLWLELLRKAAIDIENCSYRDAIFNLFSALEVYLSGVMNWIFSVQEVPNAIVNHIMKRINTKDCVALLNNYISMNKLNYNKVIKTSVELRNKIIHKGYKPEPNEVREAFRQVGGLIMKLGKFRENPTELKPYLRMKAMKELLKSYTSKMGK